MVRWLTAVVLLLAACKEIKQPEVLTNHIIPLADSCYRDDFFDAPFYQQIHYHETNKGKFVHTAEILLIERGDSSELFSCEATQTENVLLLKCQELPDEGAYTLYIGKNADSSTAQLEYNYLLTDSSWRRPTFRLISRSIRFDKTAYKPEELIKGKFEMQFEGRHTAFGQDYTDTILIRGLIKTSTTIP